MVRKTPDRGLGMWEPSTQSQQHIVAKEKVPEIDSMFGTDVDDDTANVPEFDEDAEDSMKMLTDGSRVEKIVPPFQQSRRFCTVGYLLPGVVGICIGLLLSVMSNRFAAEISAAVTTPNLCPAMNLSTVDAAEKRTIEEQPLASAAAEKETTPSDYLIESARNRSRDYDSFVNPKYLRLVSDHPALENILPNFQPNAEWTTTHFPDINIIGLPKAGTSQLYNILITHPRFRKFHLHSEFCFNLEDDDIHELIIPSLGSDTGVHDHQMVQQRLHIANEERFHSNKEDHQKWENLNMDVSQGALTVNKCVAPTKFWMQRQYLGRNRGPPSQRGKTILLLRDPAEWLWASWNYWLQLPFEDALPAYKHNWAMEPFQYRSPELFHEYMLAGDRLWPSQHLLEGFRDEKIAIYNHILAEDVQNEDFLVLKSEDMKPDRIETSGFLDELASFLGVVKDNFDTSVLHSYTNCGNHKGVDNHDCGDDNDGPTTSYDISGHRGMLPESRDLVYLHFAEECHMWKEKFQVKYEDCLAVRERLGQ